MADKNSDLFDLIKSLTKNEKRFFKIFSARHANNKNDLSYLKLFDVYDKMSMYNKNAFISAIKQKELSNIRYLKHQLYQQVLRSLNIYSHNKNIEFKIQNLLINTQILFDKGLFKQSEKILNKAKLLAEQYDLHLFMLKCFEKEKMIAREEFNKNAITFQANQLLDIEKSILNNFLTICEFAKIRSKLTLLIIEDADKKKSKKDKINEIKKEFQFIKEKKNNSFSLHEMELIIKSLIAIYNQDYRGLLAYLKQREELYESNAYQINNNELTYLAVKYNLLVTYLNLKEYNNAEQIITLLNSYRNKSTTRIVELKLFNYINVELNFYNQKGAFKESSSYEPQILKGLTKYNTSIHTHAKASIYIYLSIAFLSLQKYAKSRFWAEKVLNELPLPNSSSPIITANILAIISAFEEKQYTYLNWLIRQITSNLLASKETIKKEKILFHFFLNNDFNKLNNKVTQALFIQLKKQLEVIEKNDNKPILEAFDFITWLNSHIIGQSFAYLIQLKFNSTL